MTISLRAAGTATGASDAVTAVNPAVPTGAVAGDLSVLTVWMKPAGTTITTPSGWTKIAEHTNGAVAAGTDTGSTKVAIFVKIGATVGVIGNITFGGSPNSCGAVINTYQNATGLWDYSQFSTYEDAVNGANYGAGYSGSLDLVVDDWVFQGTAVNGDVGTQTGQIIRHASATFGTYVVRQSADTTTGTDSHGEVGDSPVTGAGIGSMQFQYANASSGSGSTIFLRLRETIPAPGPAFSTLIDDFPTLDSAKWLWGTFTQIIGGNVSINTEEGVTSKITYNLTSSSIVFEPVYGGAGVLTACVGPVAPALTNAFYIKIKGAGTVLEGGRNGVFSSVTYNAITHKYMRFRETAGTVYIETSPDTVSWTTLYSLATPYVANLYFDVAADINSMQQLNSVNIFPSSGPAPTDYWGAAA